MPSVLFVCTANVCRSPMASAIFQHLLEEAGLSSIWRVESAGTWAVEGMAASPGSQVVMSSRGLDLSNHRSRVVTKELLSTFDLILTMEKGHKEALRTEFPEYDVRVYLISELAGFSHDIHDPIGGPITDYEAAAQEITDLLKKGFSNIMKMRSGDSDR